MRKFSYFSVLVILFAASACNDSERPNPQGLFVGMGTESARPVQMVAHLPGFQKDDELSFQLYAVTASSKPQDFKIRLGEVVGKSQRVTLTANLFSAGLERASWDLLTESELQNGLRCARGADSAQLLQARLCLSNQEVTFQIQDSRSGSVVAWLKLEKDASLAIPPNKMGEDRPYALEEVVGRAKFLNYSIKQEAERLFQAKENVKLAMTNLLPHLRLRSIVAFATADITGIVESIGTLLPFLFPSNWFQWNGSKHLLNAEQSSFASLRGNEMQAAESLYFLIQRDEAVLSSMDAHLAWLEKLENNILTEEKVGILPHGSADRFGLAVLSMKQDREQLARLVALERASLSQAMALPPLSGITRVTPFQLQDLSKVALSDAAEIAQDAKAKSLEVAALAELAEASKDAKNAAVYSFLSPDSDSSLGFGMPVQISIGNSQRHEIEKKMEEVLALIEQRAVEIPLEQNAAIQAYRLSTESLRRARNQLDWLMKRHLSGDTSLADEEFLAQLSDVQEKILLATANQISSVVNYQMVESKKSRLIQTGFYEDLKGVLPGEPNEQISALLR